MKALGVGAGTSLVAAIVFGASALAQEPNVVDEALKRDLETVRNARVFFGHQSVGVNLLDGIAALSKEAGVPVTLGEGLVGANTKPQSKLDDWVKKAESTPDVQLLVLKFCYVDIMAEDNPEAVLAAYQQAVARVRQARPEAKILHVTVPLTARGSGLKNWLKRTLGRTVWDDESNVRRLAYNRALRAAFPNEPIFDLAAVESTRPDGSKEEHVVQGQPVPMMWPGYTDDGGHLNAAGQRVAARAFIAALAGALRP